MPHKNWCEKTCATCEEPCGLAFLNPCPADCNNLQPDGSRDEESCAACGCLTYTRKVGGIFYTVKELMEENPNVSNLAAQFQCYEVGDWKNIQSTEAIRDHIGDLAPRGVRVGLLVKTLEEEEPSPSGYWETNLKTTLVAPIPIKTADDLLRAAKITDPDQSTRKVRNAAVRELIFEEIQNYREMMKNKSPEDIYNDSYYIEVMESLRENICEAQESLFGEDMGIVFLPEELQRLEKLLKGGVFLETLRTRQSWVEDFDCHLVEDVNTVIELVLRDK